MTKDEMEKLKQQLRADTKAYEQRLNRFQFICSLITWCAGLIAIYLWFH
jgi:hypothetical protein